jgi:hypothetical protein
MPKNLPAARTSPLRKPPGAKQVYPNPSQQESKISHLAQLQPRRSKANQNKAEKQHHHQIPPRHITAPGTPVAIDFLNVVLRGYLVGFSALKHAMKISSASDVVYTTSIKRDTPTVYSP